MHLATDTHLSLSEGPSLFSVRATGVPRISPLKSTASSSILSLPVLSPNIFLSFLSFPPILFIPRLVRENRVLRFNRICNVLWNVAMKILLKIFYPRVLFGREQIFRSETDRFSGINHHPLDELVELSLLRRVIFQDGKNRNSEDEGIFGGEETWTYRGRNSNDPSNAAADVPQTRIVRGIRRPVLQKVSQLYIKTIKREAGPADSHPVQGWTRLRAPILCPSIVNSETDPSASIIKKVREEEGESILYAGY